MAASAHFFRWNLQPNPDPRDEVEVAAASAPSARRTVRRFLEEHDGVSWVIESVSRSPGFPIPDPPDRENPNVRVSAS